MLDFETCQRLKKAGFPQYDADGYSPTEFYYDESGDYHWCGEKHDDCYDGLRVSVPFIEDILKELGEDFCDLEFTTPKQSEWSARSLKTGIVFGSSPEQALANLYLSLLAHD
tara:strand:+ start:1093 stop:1428 length:336 start_codon:yes stop_codon:yes gene_type:complete